MMTTRKHTLAASLIALMTAAPAIAQESGGSDQQNQQSGPATQQQGGDNQQQAQTGGSDRQMPEAAAGQGSDLSDVATVDQPQGEFGTQQQGQQGQQGRVMVLDVDDFSQTIYERGFRQGYMRGLSDARDRFADRMQAIHQGAMNQRDRMRSATGGQGPGTMPQGQQAGEGQQGQQQAQAPQSAQGGGQDAQGQPSEWPGGQDSSGASDERGTIIVLPPGVSPEMFVEQLMRANEAGMQSDR